MGGILSGCLDSENNLRSFLLLRHGCPLSDVTRRHGRPLSAVTLERLLLSALCGTAARCRLLPEGTAARCQLLPWRRHTRGKARNTSPTRPMLKILIVFKEGKQGIPLAPVQC